MPGGVSAHGLVKRLAVVDNLTREICLELLRDQRRLDELDREADLQMPLDVAVEEPRARVVRYETGGTASGLRK